MRGWIFVFALGRRDVMYDWILCYGRTGRRALRIFRKRIRGPVRLLCMIPLDVLPKGGECGNIG